ncbi:cold shock domain-containing protein [Streptomyces gardneri]|uniref:cold shock domain-containing protein n=1 Tax=Nocardia TaxID=1817 RepID=UPI00135BC98C|nr:cold shock domain-containing protein [Streptomyces gardneri]MBF6203093.1 cold shock domain-containing protein [Streptomyces gardneri]UAK29958.1 cold shock domain-containing protein [Nocardia asteroides]
MTSTTHSRIHTRLPHPLRTHRDTLVPATTTEWRHGTVAWFNTEKGFGYLEPDDRTSPVFVDFRAIDTRGYKTLAPGQTVVFTTTVTDRGPEAATVRPYTARPYPLGR